MVAPAWLAGYHKSHGPASVQMAFLALVQSAHLRSQKQYSGYGAQLFNYARYQIDYIMGDSGRSWMVGVGSNFPTLVWHKLSYNTKLTYPLAGKNIYSAVTIPKSDGSVQFLRYSPAAKYDFEGAASHRACCWAARRCCPSLSLSVVELLQCVLLCPSPLLCHEPVA